MILNKNDIEKILSDENNETKINEYYNKAINGEYSFTSYEQIFFFLIVLHKCKKKFVYKNTDNPIHFLSRKKMTIDKKIYSHAELLYIAYDYYRLFYSKIKKIDIDNSLTLYMFTELMIYNYLCFRLMDSVCFANEILEIDSHNNTALFIKALILETLANKTDNCLINELISIYSMLDYNKIEFCKDIAKEKIRHYSQLKNNNSTNYSILTKKYIAEHKLDKYTVFCVEQKLQLNFLIEFGPYLETLEENFIFVKDTHLNELLINIYEDFNFSRKKYYILNEKNVDNSREWINLFLFTYSIFDKIAYFIYKYFNLNIEECNIYANQNLFESKLSNTNIQLLDINNQFIFPIYYSFMETSTKSKLHPKYRLPNESFNLRNLLTHRTSICNIKSLKKELSILTKQTRRLIQYLQLLIFIEENRKKQNLDYNNNLFLCSLFFNIDEK